MNSFNAIGNLGSDAEVRFTKAGKALTTFSVAVSSGWGDNKKTTWVNCTLWGRGETEHGLSKYLLKGAKVGIMGEIYLDEWKGQDGSIRTTLKCNVRDVTLCDSREQAAAPKAEVMTPPAGLVEDDIPFAPFDKGQFA